MTFTTRNSNRLNPKLINEHLGNVRYRLDEANESINEAQIREQVEDVLSSPSLRRKYFAEYKSQMLVEGKSVTEEGFGSWLSDKFSKAKEKVSGAIQKVKNVAKGIADVGFLGRGTTILGGQETLDIEKRKQMLGQAESEIQSDLDALSSGLQKAQLGDFDTLKKLKSDLDSKKFPNSDSFEADVAAINAEYKKAVDGFNSKAIDAKTANAIIAVLRHLVIYYQDYKIHDKNLYLNEAEEPAAGSEQQPSAPAGLDAIKGRKQGDVSKSYQAAYGATLPLGLLAGGAALMGLGVAANSEAFQSALAGLKDMKDANVSEIVKRIKPTVVKEKIAKLTKLAVGKGMGPSQALSAVTGIDMSPNAPVKNLFDPKVSPFMGPLKKAFENPGGPEAWDKAMAYAKQHPDMSFADLFGPRGVKVFGPEWRKSIDLKVGDFATSSEQIISKTVDKEVTETVTKAVKIPADTLKNKFLGALGKFAGPVLSGLGIGMAAAGAASGLMRMKGKASSRMATLKKAVDSFKDVGGEEDAVVPPEEQKRGGPTEPGGQPTAPGGEPEAKPGEPGAETPENKPEEPAAQEPEKAAEPQGQLLIQPDEILSGTGEFKTQGREFVNFYQKKLPDMDPKDVEKVLASLVRSKKMISEMLKRLNKLLKEAFDEPFSNKGQGVERGTYKQDMGHDKYKDSRVTGSKDKAVPYQKTGVSRFGTVKMMPGFQKLVDKIASETSIDKNNVLKVLELVFNNQKLASEDDAGKVVTQPIDRDAKFIPSAKPDNSQESDDEDKWQGSLAGAARGGSIMGNADDEEDTLPWQRESKKRKLQEAKTLNRWQKLAGIIK